MIKKFNQFINEENLIFHDLDDNLDDFLKNKKVIYKAGRNVFNLKKYFKDKNINILEYSGLLTFNKFLNILFNNPDEIIVFDDVNFNEANFENLLKSFNRGNRSVKLSLGTKEFDFKFTGKLIIA